MTPPDTNESLMSRFRPFISLRGQGVAFNTFQAGRASMKALPLRLQHIAGIVAHAALVSLPASFSGIRNGSARTTADR
jgi:hypothetical protein